MNRVRAAFSELERIWGVLILMAGVLASTGPLQARDVRVSFYDCRTPGQCKPHKITASGQHFSEHAMTTAHRKLPFGTRVRVTNKRNGRSVTVRVNDRGPFARRNGHYDREFDLTRGVAARLGLLRSGVATVSVQIL